jgi:hypothetical protein
MSNEAIKELKDYLLEIENKIDGLIEDLKTKGGANE